MKAFAFFLKDDTPGKNWLPMTSFNIPSFNLPQSPSYWMKPYDAYFTVVSVTPLEVNIQFSKERLFLYNKDVI